MNEKFDNPHDTLIKALEKVEDMDSVLIIYEGRDSTKCGSFDSNMTVSQCLYLIELFKAWLMRACLKTDD